MRITDLYDLRNNQDIGCLIQGLLHDIKYMAHEQFKDEEQKKFMIKIKLVPIK